MNIYDKINNGDYEPSLEHPDRLRKPFLRDRNPTAKVAQEFADSMAKYEADMQEVGPKLAAYKAEQARLETQFKRDAISEIFGDDAQRYPSLVEYLWCRAWEDEHSLGLYAVYDALLDYRDVIDALDRDIRK